MFDLSFSMISPLQNAIWLVMLYPAFVQSVISDYLSTLSLLNLVFFLSEHFLNLAR